MDIKRETSPDRARKLASDLTALDIEIPADVADTLASLDALEARKPQPTTPDDLAKAYVDGSSDKAVDTLLAWHLADNARANAWREARVRIAGRALSQLAFHHADLIDRLAEKAAPLIANLERAAEIGSVDVAALIRAGRTEDADVIAHLELTAGDLANLYNIRTRITVGAEYGGCGVWRDPRHVKVIPNGTQSDYYLAGIKAGAELWFPQPHEAEAQGRKVGQAQKDQLRGDLARADQTRGMAAYDGGGVQVA